jgi:hypothetical protein
MTILRSRARQFELPRISISPRTLAQVNTTIDNAISEITYFAVDMDRYKQQCIFCYVIPDQEDDVILGFPCIRAEDVVLCPRKGKINIKSSGTNIRFRSKYREDMSDIKA